MEEEERKLITIEQTSKGKAIEVKMEGPWKAKEIARVQRLLILAYRKNKSAIRKQDQEKEVREQEEQEE